LHRVADDPSSYGPYDTGPYDTGTWSNCPLPEAVQQPQDEADPQHLRRHEDPGREEGRAAPSPATSVAEVTICSMNYEFVGFAFLLALFWLVLMNLLLSHL
jgi:hypothetical protein